MIGYVPKKVRFAAHLLEGPAATWWDNFQITTPIDEVTWAIFEDGFRTAHISSGMMSLKNKEFHNLKQRHRSVAEYIESSTIWRVMHRMRLTQMPKERRSFWKA